MPGFCGFVLSEEKKIPDSFDISFPALTPRAEKTVAFGNFWTKQSIIDKFAEEKLFQENSSHFISTDGVILNSQSQKNKYAASDLFSLLKKMYQEHPDTFPSELRGDFDGLVFDKKEKRWTLFTNHMGSKWVFYFFDQPSNTFIFGTELKWVTELMRKLGFPPRLDVEGAYCLLTFGYMLGQKTLVESVQKIPPGSILDYQNGALSCKQYYQINNEPPVDLPKQKIIQELDARFRIAVSAEYEKDLEFGYQHIATLSGGLDSRMNVCFAKKLGYEKILNITFSQSNYLDEKIAKKIASEWNMDFLFFSLDNGNFLKPIEEIVLTNDGLALYSGAAHAYGMLSCLFWEKFGILHTGQIGDAVLGSFLSKRKKKQSSLPGAYSTLLNDKIRRQFAEELQGNPNEEVFKFINRAFNGAFNGYRSIEQFTEFSSPFLYPDFFDFAVKIPSKFRMSEQIYKDWILEKVPEAAKYAWEKTGVKVGSGKLPIFIKKAQRYARRLLLGKNGIYSMNPFNFWFESNPSLNSSFSSFFSENIDLLASHPELREDTKELFEKGNPLEKTQPLSLLAAYRLLRLN